MNDFPRVDYGGSFDASYNFRSYRKFLIAGQELNQNVEGNMYHVLASSGPFKITFDESQTIEEQSAGQGSEFARSYKRVTFESPTTQEVIVVLGYGKYNDSRASINATVNTTIAPSNTVNNPGDVVAGASATLAIGANPDRLEVELCLPSAAENPVRIGNASVTATSGSLLEPGTSKVFGVDAALYVIRTVTDETVTVLELERP